MICIGIDVAKDKHDCFISDSDGKALFKPFAVHDNREGFETLFQKIRAASDDLSKVKVGIEATGHYSYNILGYLLDKGLTTFVINQLHTNLYRRYRRHVQGGCKGFHRLPYAGKIPETETCP